MECHKSLTVKREKIFKTGPLLRLPSPRGGGGVVSGEEETISRYVLAGWSSALPFCVQIKLTLLCLPVSSDSRACSRSLMVVKADSWRTYTSTSAGTSPPTSTL